jgi:hypothetical protein
VSSQASDRDIRQIALMLEQELVYAVYVKDDNQSKIDTLCTGLKRHLSWSEWQPILEPYAYPEDDPETAEEKLQSLLDRLRSWLAKK